MSFDHVVHAALDLPPPRFRSLAELLFADGDPAAVVLVGPVGHREVRVTLGDLRRAAHRAGAWVREAGLAAGDTVVLLRLPRTPEIPLAVAFLALAVQGLRVVLPMTFDASSLPALLDGASAAMWCADDATAREACAALGVRAFSVIDDLRLGEAAPEAPLPALDPEREALVLTTSGSLGEPRLLAYTEAALLRVGAAWEAAGLMDPARTGGPSLCPLLSHSMGVRNVLHAVWNRRPTLLLPPEWLHERPAEAARYLLAHPPAHLTGGPALLRALAEYARVDPDLRAHVVPRLRCLVSSGAGFDPALAALFPEAVVANAFGTTETQQVLSTLLGGAPGSLGRPLPGVSVAVAYVDETRAIGRLFVRSPFGARRYVGGTALPEWLETGDLARCEGDDLFHVGRADADFLKSGLGLKVPLAGLEGAGLPGLEALVCFEAPARDGLVAVAFVGERDPGDAALQADVREAIAARREHAPQGPLSELRAVVLAAGRPPLRGPGKLDRERVRREHADRLAAVSEARPRVPRECLEVPPAGGAATQPHLAELRRAIGLDRAFVRAEGDHLFDADGARVLDLVGGYGANLLGHGHPAIRDAVLGALRGVPQMDQGAARPEAEALARALSLRVGAETGRRYVTCFASTGAEAVELALKHALLERRAQLPADRRPVILALRGAFHGKTLGALNALSSADQRAPFAALLGARTVFLPAEGGPEAEALLRATAASEPLLAVLAEPVLGEGGVVEVPPAWLAQLRLPGVPLIVDEIQCGLGRTGAWLASAGVRADYYLLGKALGGGVAKIAVVLIDRARYRPEFDELQGSTFAGDTLSCAVARAVLAVIERDDVPRRAREAGERLRARLLAVAARHPLSVKAVRGRGLMLGVELAAPSGAILGALARRGLGYVAASFLLHRHRVRALPTLSAPATLRLASSAYVDDAAIEQAGAAFEALAGALEAGDLRALLGHLAGDDGERADWPAERTPRVGERTAARSLRRPAPVDPATDGPAPDFRLEREPPAPGARRVAFLHNPLHPADELTGDAPSLGGLPAEQRLALAGRLEVLLGLQPLLMFSRNLFGGRVWLAGLTLPASPQALDHLHRTGEHGLVRRRLQEALEMAAGLGCETVTFGAHTSILTADATTVEAPPGVQVSSGNSFTVAIALAQLEQACARAGVDLGPGGRVAVVGAGGNIGSALTRLLLQRTAARLLLVGRPGSRARLEERLASRLHDARVAITDDPAALRGCDAIVLATSATEPVVLPAHVAADRPVVILDLAVPRGASPHLREARPRALLIDAGLVRLPGDADFRLAPHLPPGVVPACAAEALLMGLEPRPLKLAGSIRPEDVEVLAALGRAFGLGPA